MIAELRVLYIVLIDIIDFLFSSPFMTVYTYKCHDWFLYYLYAYIICGNNKAAFRFWSL